MAVTVAVAALRQAEGRFRAADPGAAVARRRGDPGGGESRADGVLEARAEPVGDLGGDLDAERALAVDAAADEHGGDAESQIVGLEGGGSLGLAHVTYATASHSQAQAVCGRVMRMEDELEAVKQTARRYTAADKARDKARDEHFTAVLTALRAGKAPTDVSDLSPFTSTHLRQVARDAGIEAPARRRPPRRHS